MIRGGLQTLSRVSVSKACQKDRGFSLVLRDMAKFDVLGWNETYKNSWANVNVENPVYINHWTKASRTQGGGISYGDASGEFRDRSYICCWASASTACFLVRLAMLSGRSQTVIAGLMSIMLGGCAYGICADSVKELIPMMSCEQAAGNQPRAILCVNHPWRICLSIIDLVSGSKFARGIKFANIVMLVWTGFLRYTPMAAPVGTDLGKGFPENFIEKTSGEPVGIDIVLGALKHAGVDVLKGGVVTFRNNINKVFGTVIDPKKEWAVSACMLSDHPTLFLNVEVGAYQNEKIRIWACLLF